MFTLGEFSGSAAPAAPTEAALVLHLSEWVKGFFKVASAGQLASNFLLVNQLVYSNGSLMDEKTFFLV